MGQKPWINSDQLHNYAGNFIVSIVLTFIAMVLIAMTIPIDKPVVEKSPSLVTHLHSVIPVSSSDMHANDKESPDNGKRHNQIYSDDEKAPLIIGNKPVKNQTSLFGEIFSLQHMIGVWKTCTKTREGNLRSKVWLLVLALNLSMIPFFGAGLIMFPIIQKLYNWNAIFYSTLNTWIGILHIIAMVLFIPILFKVLKANDLQIAMIGTILTILGSVFIGTIVSPMGFYLQAFITSFSTGITSGIRSYLSKVLPKNEVAKFFAMIITMEALLKCVSSVIFAYLLDITISTYPTFSFHVMALILIITLVLIVYVDLKTKYPL